MSRALLRLSAASVVGAAAVLVPALPRPPVPAVRHGSSPIGGIVRAPWPAALVGVTWPAGRAAPGGVMVRASPDGESWGRWTSLQILDGESPDRRGRERSRRDGTAPLWVGRAVAVRVRFTGRAPAGARLSFVDPGRVPIRPRARTAHAAPGAPEIASRVDWGADESIRRGSARYASGLEAAIVHHTASGNAYGPDDSPRIVRSIYAYHVQARGWDDIGYNLLVDRYGRIFEGRAGGADRPVIGAHAQGFNTGTAGVALIGTFTGTDPPPQATAALRDVLAWKLDLHLVDPLATTTMRSSGSSRYPDGAVVTLPTIAGHRDTGDTDCPGGRLHAMLPGLRDDVARTGDPKAYAPRGVLPAFTPNGDGIADAAEVRLRFSSPVSWTAEIAGGAGAVVRTFTGTGQAGSITWDGRDETGVTRAHDRYTVRVTASNANGATRPATTTVDLWAWPDGTALEGLWSRAVLVLEQGLVRHVTGWHALVSRLPPGEAVGVPDFVASLYPAGPELGFRDGAVVRAAGAVWVISAGMRRAASAEALAALGYDPGSIVDADPAELAPHPEGPPVDPAEGHPDGTALRGALLPLAWKLGGAARLVRSDAIRLSHGIRDVDVIGPADAAIAAAGPLVPIGFRDGTLITTKAGRVWVISAGLRRWIPSAERFAVLGYRWENVRVVSEADAALHPEGPPV